jgi:GNAT superfamily N-acetyltransferase
VIAEIKTGEEAVEIRYIPDGTMTEEQQKDVDIINKICLSDGPDDSGEEIEFDINTYEYSAPEDGMFLLFDGERAIGRVAVHKVQSDYDGKKYFLGGFGGLAVLPEYQGKGYARKLAEAALEKASEIGVDVACMETNAESGIAGLYQKLGFEFLNRPAYFINHGNNEVTDENVMIMGLRNKKLADKILTTNKKFHYGNILGHW